MTARPWMKFYPQDWRSDEKLRLCSLGARGLWIEMLAIMHRSEQYGHLLISGHVPTDAQLAVQVGATPEQVSEHLGELESAGVFSRARTGAIYSRRMTRDEKKAANARKNGKKGGNPTLSNKRGNLTSVNPPDKPPDNGRDKAQRPEARDQKLDSQQDSLSKTAARTDDIADPDLLAIMEIVQPVAPFPDPQVLLAWRQDGIDIDGIAIPVIRKLTARERDRGGSIGRLKYFDAAVREGWREDEQLGARLRAIAGGQAG